jgi:hypothetical protein
MHSPRQAAEPDPEVPADRHADRSHGPALSFYMGSPHHASPDAERLPSRLSRSALRVLSWSLIVRLWQISGKRP